MIHHYLTLVLRRFRRQAFFSAITISGLGAGLAACLLIALFIRHETSYDRFLPKGNRICQLVLDAKFGDMEGRTSNTPPPAGPVLAANFPEIESYARVFSPGSVVVRRETSGQARVLLNTSALLAVDSNFVELFGFPLLEGDPVRCLNSPDNLVITEKMARTCFGDASPMGQTLWVGDQPHPVTGVLKNLPANSTLQFDFLQPIRAYKIVDRFSWSWVWLQVDTWVRLRQEPTAQSLADLSAKFPAVVRTHATPAFERIGQNFEDLLKNGGRWNLQLRPLAGVHLHSAGLDSRLQTLGDAQQVRVFGWVGVFILLLALVNFVNLSTARSLQRGKEVGVQKVLGSQRGALIGQFLVEATFYCALAMVLALGLVHAGLPAFNQVTGLPLRWETLFTTKLGWLVAGLPVVAGILGGLYPALYLSGMKMAQAFKNNSGANQGGQRWVRSGLVVFQFAVTTVLITGTFVVYRQLEFTRNKPLGLHQQNVLVLKNAQRLGENGVIETFRQQLLALPEVVAATHSTALPTQGEFGDFYVPEQGNQSRAVAKDLALSSFMTDYDFIPTLGITMAAGRNFAREFPSDSAGVILNQAAVKAIGWKNPIGHWLRYPGGDDARYQVIGVMNDFHTSSFRTAIAPFALFHESSQTYQLPDSYLALRLHPGAEKAALQKVDALWRSKCPRAPLEYSFLDTDFARQYSVETTTGAVLGLFTLLSLLIGCLGLFALAAFSTEQRRKEIGVRKVLGASVAQVTALLSRDFLRPVGLAILIATPLAYYAMQRWLEHYVYRIELTGWIFLAAGTLAIGIALLTVSFQSVKAALADPVNSLRSE